MDKTAKKIGSTVILMVLFTLFAKALGLVRQIMIANIFGAGSSGVAFSAASKIPFAIFDMLFSTAIVGSFLPIYRGNLTQSTEKARRFSSSFLTAITAITAAVAILGVLLATPIIRISAPNLAPETADLAANLLRIMFPAVIFAGMAYTLIGILQSHERFLLPASISAISNLVILSYLVLFAQADSVRAVYGLAIAYLCSWFVQFLTLAIPLAKAHLLPKPTKCINDQDLRLSLARSLPVMLGSWLIPIGTLTANFFSSYIMIDGTEEAGAAIVVFENAFSVFSIAAGLLTYGICNYIFPKLSASFAKGDEKGFSSAVRKSLFATFAITLPIASALMILAKNGISLLYERGNFTPELVNATANSLRALAFAMPAYGLTELFSRVCYSSGKVRFPMIASAIGISVGLLSSSLLLLTDTLSVFTVALANAIGQLAAALTLLILSLRAFPAICHGFSAKKILGFVISFLFSTVTMLLAKKTFEKFLQNLLPFQNLVIITIVFTLGLVVYLICMRISKALAFSDHQQ